MDSVFDADWKKEVEVNVSGYSSLSKEAGDTFLYKEMEGGDYKMC